MARCCGIQSDAGLVEPGLTDRCQLFAALPESQRLLKCQATTFEPLDDLDELITGLLVANGRGSVGAAVCGHAPSLRVGRGDGIEAAGCNPHMQAGTGGGGLAHDGTVTCLDDCVTAVQGGLR